MRNVLTALSSMMDAPTKPTSASSTTMKKSTSASMATHGRHPNFSFLMGAPKGRQAVSVTEATPSIAERPYLYWFTGRKWPSSLHQKALCEAATCDIPLTEGAMMRSGSNQQQLCSSSSTAARYLRCTRYEIVGSPVVLERFQFSHGENSLCRMFCSKQIPQEARAGGAMAHLEGHSVDDIVSLLTEETAPVLLPEHGHREASWCTFTSTMDDERSSESSCSGCVTTSSAMISAKPRPQSSELDSMGRSSMSSCGGLSTTATPLTPISARGSTGGHSPEPTLAPPPPPPPVVIVTPQCHYKTPTIRSVHLSFITDLIARDELLQCVLVHQQHHTAETAQTFRNNASAVTSGWAYWRTLGTGELSNLERRSVVGSMHEIMHSNQCSRNAFHLAVSLLDRYIAVSALLGAASLPLTSPWTGVLEAPSSSAIRTAIACSISIASKSVDIYAPSLERLGMSLGTGVFSGDVSFEQRELNYLTVIRYYVHPLTVEEVSESLLDLWFGYSTQAHPSVGSPTPLMSGSARRAATFVRYLVDTLVRSASYLSIPPTYIAAAVMQYAIECVRVAEALPEKELLPIDKEGIEVFMAHLSDQDLANQAVNALRRNHHLAYTRPAEFLETMYGTSQVTSRSCRTAFMESFSIKSLPCPAAPPQPQPHKRVAVE